MERRDVRSVDRGSELTAEIAPGASHLRQFLSIDEQRTLVGQCQALLDGPVPGYVPIVRGGGKMHVRMLCLGATGTDGPIGTRTRSDYDSWPRHRFPANSGRSPRHRRARPA